MSVSEVLENGMLAFMGPPPPEQKRACRTCRWWDAHSRSLTAGDCRPPGDHRYWHVRIPASNGRSTIAFLDSFGPEETKPDYVCGAWDDGYLSRRISDRRNAVILRTAASQARGKGGGE